ncbi:hypothetical protein [Lysobacter sp. GX 14042]|uniref:hypothetical protein n=1 Tax=Lysobacter sp. GX 14042 TaxID=2907155 RepID=UPI0031BB4625
MERVIAAAVLMSLASLAHAQAPADCAALAAPQLAPAATDIAPVAGELELPAQPLGIAGGVLDQSLTGDLSAEQVLYRQQLEGCAQLASVQPISGGAMEVPSVSGVPPMDAAPAELEVVPGAGAMVASATPAAPAPELIDAATYKPRTEFDNTPWRFNMNQNGERMTADAFAAWMEAKGVRVAKGRTPVEGDAAAGELLPQAPEGAAEEGIKVE